MATSEKASNKQVTSMATSEKASDKHGYQRESKWQASDKHGDGSFVFSMNYMKQLESKRQAWLPAPCSTTLLNYLPQSHEVSFTLQQVKLEL
jgi:hypothetical protein